MPGKVAKQFPGTIKVNVTTLISIPNLSKQSIKKVQIRVQKKSPKCAQNMHNEGLSARRSAPAPESTSERAYRDTSPCLKKKINFFPLHKKRGEKNLLIYIQAHHETPPDITPKTGSKTQSKGRAINGASFAFRGDK